MRHASKSSKVKPAVSIDAADLHQLLKSAVSRAGEKLGFILLTGSSENFIRDCLAYECFAAGMQATRDLRVRGEDGYLHIVDLAVGTHDEPESLVELKQLYLKDFKGSTPLYFQNVTRDILKRAALRTKYKKASVYGLVLLREVDLTNYTNSGQFLAYAEEDFSQLPTGVSRMNDFLQTAPGMEGCSPSVPSEAQLGEWDVNGALVRLYAWVLTARNL